MRQTNRSASHSNIRRVNTSSSYLKITHRVFNLTSETQLIAWHMLLSSWRKGKTLGGKRKKRNPPYRNVNNQHPINPSINLESAPPDVLLILSYKGGGF